MIAKPRAAAFFDAIASRYDREYARTGETSRASLAWVLRELPPRAKLLDLGVGTGRELPALLDAGHSPVGLDASEAMLALCANRSRPIPLHHGDLWSDLPWDDATFDAVIALHGTLAHSPTAAARGRLPVEIARILRPGGVFLAEVPTEAWLEAAQAHGGSRFAEAHPSPDALARFVDAKSGASVDVWATSPEDWSRLFSGPLRVRSEPGLEGELRIVGTK